MRTLRLSSKQKRSLQAKNNGKAHLVEFFYSEKDLKEADGKPLVDIIRSIEQMLYSDSLITYIQNHCLPISDKTYDEVVHKYENFVAKLRNGLYKKIK